MGSTVLEIKNVTKQFPGVVALNHVNLSFEKGVVHALLGENGAGKSTLIKIISGVYDATEGEVILEGRSLKNLNVKKCKELGIAAIQQELNLVPELTIAENVFLGSEKTKMLGFTNHKLMNRLTQELMDRFKIELSPSMKIRNLSIAQQQIVEIARAMLIDSKVFILDEPTDVLTDKETEILFDIVHELKAQGKAIIYISHRLEELPVICDSFSVLRDGNYMGSGLIRDCSREDIIKLMIGRDLSEQFPYEKGMPGETVLELQGCVRRGTGRPVDIGVRKGETLGLYGLVGSGRTELMKALLGVEKLESGKIMIGNRYLKKGTVAKAHAMGLFYSTEDRKAEGIINGTGIDFNITLPSLGQVSKGLFISKGREESLCNDMIHDLSIKTPSLKTEIQQLSGGNQQKVLLARALATKPKVLVLDEPTRGIDVGTKADIYNIITRLKKEGVAVVVISSELPEIMGISDRVVVFKDSEIKGEFTHEDATEYGITNCAFGIS